MISPFIDSLFRSHKKRSPISRGNPASLDLCFPCYFLFGKGLFVEILVEVGKGHGLVLSQDRKKAAVDMQGIQFVLERNFYTGRTFFVFHFEKLGSIPTLNFFFVNNGSQAE